MLKLFFCDGSEITVLGEILTDQDVHVFVGTTHLMMHRMGKTKVSSQVFGNVFVLGEFLAVVRSQGVNLLRMWP